MLVPDVEGRKTLESIFHMIKEKFEQLGWSNGKADSVKVVKTLCPFSSSKCTAHASEEVTSYHSGTWFNFSISSLVGTTSRPQ